MIVIINYGGQYVHRIWRSLRELDMPSPIVPKETTTEDIAAQEPLGVILSGGAYSVHSDSALLGDFRGILDLDLPILGICLGHQLIAHHFGGQVKPGESGEYAAVELAVLEEDDLFRGLPERITVWMSHRDEVVSLPPSFRCLAESEACGIEAMKHEVRPVYGVQFHPEVHHTPQGKEILSNFINVCKNSG